jgi:hypothetical protein
MCVCIIEFVMVSFKMLSCNALSVVSGTCHILTILSVYIYIYIKYFRRILVPWYVVNALMMTS